MRLEICTGCHAREGERHFAGWLQTLETRLGVGYFGGSGEGVEVEFVSCLSSCEQGFSVTVEGDVMVLEDPSEFAELVERVRRVAQAL